MKKILFLLIGLMFMFASCSDGGNDSPDTPNPNPTPTPEEIASITCSTTSLSLGYEGGEKTLSFTANKNWIISIANSISWCTISQTAGTAGTFNVSLKVSENQDYDDRNVTIIIKCDNATHNIVLTQKQKDALLITTNKYEVEQTGGNIEVEVKANIDYQVQIAKSASDWIKESSSRGLSSYKHSFIIATSDEYDKREGEIHFKSGDKVETVKVYQTGGAVLVLSQNEYSVSDKGETISVELKSNTEYGVQMPDVDWLKEDVDSRGLSSHTLKYVIAANETYDSRSTEIIFYDKNSDLKDTLKIVQVQKDAIILSQKEVTIKSEGDIIEVKLSANVDFEVTMPDVDWVTQVSSRAMTEHTLYFKVTENTGEQERKTEITFTDKDSLLSDTITITQEAKNVLRLVKDEYTVSSAGETISVTLESNVVYDIQMVDVDWITETTFARGVSIDSLKFVIAANETYNTRAAEIIFYDKNSDLKDTLKIVQTQKDAIILSKTEYTISAEGGEIDIDVSANIDFSIEISGNWIKQSATSRGLENKQVHLIVDEITEDEEREALVSFIYGDVIQDAKIIQNGKDIPYVTFMAYAPQTFCMSRLVSKLEYSLDGGEWCELGTYVVVFGGEHGNLRLRGNNKNGTASSRDKYSKVIFGYDVPVECKGDIRTLLNYKEYDTVYTYDAKFCSLFRDCSCLISAPDLPATELGGSCYHCMFDGCTNLQKAPKLPATILRFAYYGYSGMFANCVNLREAPELPAIELAIYCYSGMFRNCTNLQKAPNLPATILAENCYVGMFSNCTSLCEAPELPATELMECCYSSMFSGCINLIRAQKLPATKLTAGSYSDMFRDCTNLTEVPELPATTLAAGSYTRMFSGCTGLKEILELPATILSPNCYKYMFENCINLTKVPKLPATTLTTSCYLGMFSGCTNLSKAPILSAKTLVEKCYSEMFKGCENLSQITMLATNIEATDCLSNWLENVSPSGTFTKAKSMDSLPSSVSGIPHGWIVVNYED